MPVPETGLRRQGSDHVAVGSYNPSESLLSSSPAPSSPSGRVGVDGDFSEESDGWYRYRRSGSGKFDLTRPDTTPEKPLDNPEKSSAAPVLESKKPVHVPGIAL